MEFLVHIEVLWPPDADPEEKARLAAAEGARARELIAEGRHPAPVAHSRALGELRPVGGA